jgi:hypothetical protein
MVRGMYHTFIHHMRDQLANIDTWFAKAREHATAKKFDANILMQFRLAPDQLPFVRQVQIVCDTAKLGAARLIGKDAPAFEDTETTLEQLSQRIAKTRAYLETITEADLAGAATRTISTPRWEGKTMTGENYFVEHVVPNFHFHYTTTYALLRHAGVDLGKKDYLGALTMK